tara:strand:+ start:206 stop:481 length:276 start_codon:yes stop_codon:yes gene_type:complete
LNLNVFSVYLDKYRNAFLLKLVLNVENTFSADQHAKYMADYLDALSSVQWLYRLFFDILKGGFEPVRHLELNAVQALLFFSISENHFTPSK